MSHDAFVLSVTQDINEHKVTEHRSCRNLCCTLQIINILLEIDITKEMFLVLSPYL